MGNQNKADVLWQQVRERGVELRELGWIAKHLPERVEEAWEMFKAHATQNDLRHLIESVPSLRDRAWQRYMVHADADDIIRVIDYVEEAWKLVRRYASVSTIARAMFHCGKRQEQCWHIVRERGTADDILTAFDAAREKRVDSISDEVWCFLRPRAENRHLIQFLRRCPPSCRDEIWSDLRATATPEDMREVIIYASANTRLEAVQMLVKSDPSRDNLWFVIKRFPSEERKVSAWFRKKTVHIMPAIARTAITLLLQEDLPTDDIYRLSKYCRHDPDLEACRLAKLAEASYAAQSAVLPLLVQLKEEHNEA
jgi:hypothetical protein